MRLGLNYILFTVGVILSSYSFIERASLEKDLYKVYIEKQKESLLRGWEIDWRKHLVKNTDKLDINQKYSIYIRPNGELLSKDFFPKRTELSLKKTPKTKEELMALLKYEGSYIRAIALKKLNEEFNYLDKSNLSPYELSLFDSYVRSAYHHIFKTWKNEKDYTRIEVGVVFKGVLVRDAKEQGIELFVPNKEVVRSEFEKFLRENELSSILIDPDNPFNIIASKNFNPLRSASVRLQASFVIGVLFILVALIAYILELRQKRKVALKRISFLNQLIHELKTPITGIRLNSELLKKYGYDQELLESVLISGNRLIEFFDDIVLINSKNKNSLKEKIKYGELEETLRSLTESEKISFAFTSSRFDYKDKECFIDLARFKVIMRNLIKNSLRYADKAQVNLFVDQDKLVVDIIDDGPGISKKEARKIFKEFYRSSEAKNKSPDGIGIGLFIVNKLVREMGASIKLLNPGKKGAHFQLMIGDIYE